MHPAQIEHVNISVTDAQVTSQELCTIFGWKIRWIGKDNIGQDAYHIGPKGSYIAIVTAPTDTTIQARPSPLNHIGIVVDDLDEIESRVVEAGYKTHSHGDYDPGRRFYYHDKNGMEYEIVSYSKKTASFKAAFTKQLGAMAESASLYK